MSKGSVPVLYGLSSDEDLTTLHYVACTLVRLGMEEQCHARMIQEGAARYGSACKTYKTSVSQMSVARYKDLFICARRLCYALCLPRRFG